MSTEPNVFALLAASARGDLDAQRELARAGVAKAGEGDSIVALLESSIIARMAAAQGTIEDANYLCAVLSMLGNEYLKAGCDAHADVCFGEVAAMLNRLADQGDEFAAANLEQLLSAMSPNGLALCHMFENEWKEKLDA